MIQAISACPTTIAEILSAAERIANDEIKIDEICRGATLGAVAIRESIEIAQFRAQFAHIDA